MRRRLLALLLFGVIAAVYTICCTPDFTWVNMDCDGFYYYNKTAHLVSWGADPVYAAVGHTLAKLPIGTDPWRAAFFASTLPAIIAAVLIFYAVKKQTTNNWAPYISATVFAASPIVISQAIVHEVYTMAAMFCALAYLLYVYGKHTLCLAAVGLAFCTHWLCVVPVVFAFAIWTPRKGRLFVLVPFLAAPFILGRYFGTYDIVGYWLTMPSVVLHGDVTQLPQRALDTLRIVVVGVGIAWIPALLYLKNWKQSLPILIIIFFPLAHLLTSAHIEAYVQLTIALPFIAVAAGLGVERLHTKQLAPIMLSCSVIMLLLLPLSWDIGKTLDRTPTTARAWLNQVEAIPSNSIIVASRQLDGAEDGVGMLVRSAVDMLNIEQDRNLVWVSVTPYVYPNDDYGERTRLQSLDLVTPYVPYDRKTMSIQDFYDANMVALARANDVRVYRTLITEPEVFGCELVELKLL